MLDFLKAEISMIKHRKILLFWIVGVVIVLLGDLIVYLEHYSMHYDLWILFPRIIESSYLIMSVYIFAIVSITFVSDIRNGTLKNVVAYGEKRSMVFLVKLFMTILYSIVCLIISYIIFALVILIVQGMPRSPIAIFVAVKIMWRLFPLFLSIVGISLLFLMVIKNVMISFIAYFSYIFIIPLIVDLFVHILKTNGLDIIKYIFIINYIDQVVPVCLFENLLYNNTLISVIFFTVSVALSFFLFVKREII